MFFQERQNQVKINTWGFITPLGLGDIVKISTHLNGLEYKLLLEEQLPIIESIMGPFIFQHDNAKPHIHHAVKKFLVNYDVIDNWSPKSPDLNIIENVWSMVNRNYQKKVRQEGQAFTEIRLWNHGKLQICIVAYLNGC
jgi:hypothetical protein